jgi:hypothetical protein
MDLLPLASDAVESELEVGALALDAPAGVSDPVVDDNPTASLAHSAHGVSLSAARNEQVNADTRTHSTAVGLSRGALSVDVSRSREGGAGSTALTLEKGWLGMYHSNAWSLPGGPVGTTLSVGGWRDSLLVGGDAARTGDTGLTQSLGALALFSANRQVRDLGEHTGNVQELHGTRKIELTTTLSRGAGFGAGVAGGWIGVGGSLTLDEGRDVMYRTHVSPERARKLLHAETGVARVIKDKARVVGMLRDPVEIPDLASPELLRVGDELAVSTSGAFSLGVALGGVGMRLGAKALARGGFHLAVRKLDHDRVELAVTPSKVRGIHVFADAPLVLDVRAARLVGGALRQAFVFDISQTSAREAYQRALKGDLPNGLHAVKSVSQPTDEALVLALRQEVLPAGVTRSHLEKLDLERVRTGFGINFGPIQEGGIISGLGLHRVTTRERHFVTDGEASIIEETRGLERRREVLLSGTEHAGVSATLRSSALYDDKGTATWQFEGLGLKGHFSDSRVRGLELNDEVIDHINTAFGTLFPHFQRKGHSQSRQVTLERRFDAADFAALARMPPQSLALAAHSADTSEEDLRELSTTLSQLTRDHDAARALQDYVATHGMKGFGALHRLLGKPEQLAVTTSSSAYEEPTEQARTLKLKYGTPVAVGSSPDDLLKRFSEGKKALARTEQSVLDAESDVLLSAGERVAMVRQITRVADEIRELLRVDHLPQPERERLVLELNAGWVSSADEHLIDVLQQSAP